MTRLFQDDRMVKVTETKLYNLYSCGEKKDDYVKFLFCQPQTVDS